jgi:hypothetical protein
VVEGSDIDVLLVVVDDLGVRGAGVAARKPVEVHRVPLDGHRQAAEARVGVEPDRPVAG